MNERDSQRLAKIDEKMEQMKAQKKDIVARNNKRQRQERTRRLIQLGALSEKYFDVKDIQPKDYEFILYNFLSSQNARDYLEQLKISLNGGGINEQRINTESTTNEPSGIPN